MVCQRIAVKSWEHVMVIETSEKFLINIDLNNVSKLCTFMHLFIYLY